MEYFMCFVLNSVFLLVLFLVGETAPRELRGELGTITRLSIQLGNVIATLLGIPIQLQTNIKTN